MTFDARETVARYARRDIEEALIDLAHSIERIEKFEERPADLALLRAQLTHTTNALRKIGYTFQLIQDTLQILATGRDVEDIDEESLERFHRRKSGLIFGDKPGSSSFGITN